MRATVVTPTTATTRHIMRMKYGYARANLGITSPPPRPAGWDRFPSWPLSCPLEIRSGSPPPRGPLPSILPALQLGCSPANPISLSVLPGCFSHLRPGRFLRSRPLPAPPPPAERSECPDCRAEQQSPAHTSRGEAGHPRFGNRFPFPWFAFADRVHPQNAKLFRRSPRSALERAL